MPQIDVRIQILVQPFADGAGFQIGEALFFPEVTSLANSRADVANVVAENVLKLLTDVPNSELHRRVVREDAQPFDVEILLEPIERTEAWREPVILKLPAVKWSQRGSQLGGSGSRETSEIAKKTELSRSQLPITSQPQSDSVTVVYIPSLKIEVLANRATELPRLIEEQVRSALARSKATRSLRSLTQLSRCRELTLESRVVEHFVMSPKQQELDEQQPNKKERSLLNQIGTPLAGFGLPQAYERNDEVRQLAEVLGGRVARCALLVGPSGVGKTTIVRELVRQSTEHGLSEWRFWNTSGSRLVSGMTGFGMWQERCEELRREVVKEHAILHVGSLWELLEVGKSEHQSQGIASFMRPALARGEMLVIAECTPEQVSLIERQDIALLRAFQQIRIHEPTREAGLRILTTVARADWKTTAELFAPAAIEELDRLHRRFATYSAYPARPIRFLQNLRRDRRSSADSGDAAPSKASSVISPQEVTQAFSRETGLPLWLLDEHERLDLAASEKWFAERVIGQPEAVSLVTNLLATLKAGLNREHKPLASFLFIGPTGVGKTEMAKTLAEFLFGARKDSTGHTEDSRLIRIDMSEYADPRAVQRLIGGTTEAEGVLTARVREQPFAVVLLDEFEKADSSLFDLLLQILGEGRLTDAAGRVADFRNCVVIMTSNLGATTFAKGAVGFGAGSIGTRESAEHFEKAVRGFVRPELFNRLDRIVPFAPLDVVTARKVVRRQLALVKQRDGLKYRRIAIDFGEDVVDDLLKHGFEPRYGARALKRVIEERLLAPLSERFNEHSADVVLSVDCIVVDDQLRFIVKAQTDAVGRILNAVGANAGQLELVTQLRDLRSALQHLQSNPVVVSVKNEVVRLERQEVVWNKKPTYSEDELEQRHQLERRRQWLQRVDAAYSELASREDSALMALYGDDSDNALTTAAESQTESLRDVLDRTSREWRELLFDLLDLLHEEPNQIRITLLSDDHLTLQQLARGYLASAQDTQAQVKMWQFLQPPGKREVLQEEQWTLEKLHWKLHDEPLRSDEVETWRLLAKPKIEGMPTTPLLLRKQVPDPKAFLRTDLTGVLGLFVELTGPRVLARYIGEEGLHAFVFAHKKSQCLVQSSLPKLNEYLPPFGIERRGGLMSSAKTREFDFIKGIVSDPLLDKPVEVTTATFESVLATVLESRHEKAARALSE